MTRHPKITDRLLVLACKRDDGTGFCNACGHKHKGFVEPDASGYTCGRKACGLPQVYGAEQLLLETVA